MAGLFVAENMTASKRRDLVIRDLKARAKRNRLGEVLQRIAAIMCILMVIGQTTIINSSTHNQSKVELTSNAKKLPFSTPARGNTGKRHQQESKPKLI